MAVSSVGLHGRLHDSRRHRFFQLDRSDRCAAPRLRPLDAIVLAGANLRSAPGTGQQLVHRIYDPLTMLRQ